MRAFALVLLILAAPAVFSQAAGTNGAKAGAAAAASPVEIIASCAEADAEDAIGVQELDEFCPGIEHALVEFGYAPFISATQLEELSTYSFVDLQHLAQRYTPRDSVPQHDLEGGKLDSILRSLEQPARAELAPGWFERFKRWLRKAFAQQEADPDSWVNRWLPDLTISEAVSKAIGYVLVVLVIVFAIGILINELRVAGLMKRGKNARHARAAGSADDSGRAVIAASDLNALPLRERPSTLLRMLVATLVNTGRLRTERSLTHRELGSRASLEEQTQRECFQRVASLGERTVYGAGNVSAEEIESVVAAGQSLNAQLLAAAHTA